jgi:hypothetical protein
LRTKGNKQGKPDESQIGRAIVRAKETRKKKERKEYCQKTG